MKHFDPFANFFKTKGGNNNNGGYKSSGPGLQENVDIEVTKKNVFQNNVLYFQKYRDLEEKVDYLEKLNSFLVSQILQIFSQNSTRSASNPKTGSQQTGDKGVGAAEAVRKKSMKFEDDRSLNRTFQMFKIFKGLLDTGGSALNKISSIFFPPSFDFENALYEKKNHLSLLNVVLKSSINGIISLKDQIDRTRIRSDKVGIRDRNNPALANTTLMLGRAKDGGDYLSFNSGKSIPEPADPDSGLLQSSSRKVDTKQQGHQALSEGFSISNNRVGVDDPMFSESFLNATDIKNNMLRPFRLDLKPEVKIDQETQVREEDWTGSFIEPMENSKDHFSII